ncbi:hypothetical protein, partial [Pseudomonas syringae]|uniref:hypothetical protein n=1 Tax=Pseudomonas syringae TaxID=317 RepID=UPI001C556A23
RNAKQGRQVEKNRLGNEDGANGLIVQRLPKKKRCQRFKKFHVGRLCRPKKLTPCPLGSSV